MLPSLQVLLRQHQVAARPTAVHNLRLALPAWGREAFWLIARESRPARVELRVLLRVALAGDVQPAILRELPSSQRLGSASDMGLAGLDPRYAEGHVASRRHPRCPLYWILRKI